MRPAVEIAVASTWDGHRLTAGERVRLRLRLAGDELRIAVSAPFHGDPAPAGPAGPTGRLWEHEVVELFVAGAAEAGAVRYTEVELSPWGHHLVLRLRGVRHVVDERLPLTFRACRRDGRWLGAARLARALLPPPPWRVNACAIHGEGTARRYLCATPLPAPRPDFHQPDRFPPLVLTEEG